MKNIFLVAFVFLTVLLSQEVHAQEVFEDHLQNPVFSYSGVPGTFDQMRIFSHDIVSVDGEYWMYYSGVGNGNSVQIGLAKSEDGISWQRYSSDPVFKCGDNGGSCLTGGNWSNYRVSVVSVEHVNGMFKMWFQGDNQNLSSVKRLGYATSQDGLNWTSSLLNPVFTAKEGTGIKYDSVLKISEGYRLYFTDNVEGGYYYVDSADGIDWTGLVFKIGDEKVHTVDVVNNKFLAVYGEKIAISDDGKSFNFEDPVATINSNPGPDEARVVFLVEDGLIKTWRVNYDGTVIWNYGNFSINYASMSTEGSFLPEEDKYPLYTQTESPYPSLEETAGWADDTYANGYANCGKSIAECGCAITSLVMLARASGVTTAVDGSDVNPGNMNAWLIDNGGYNSSQSLNWSSALKFLGRKDEEGVIETPFKLKAHNEKSLANIQLEAKSDNHVMGFSDSVSQGHYFVVSDYTDGKYLVRDPWFYNTKTLSDVDSSALKIKGYNNDLDKANIFTFGQYEKIAGFLDITLASPAELRLTDSDGNVTGYDEDGNRFEIPTGSYDPFEYIGNPAASTTGDIHYVKRLMVLEADGDMTLEVVGTGEGDYSLGIALEDVNGDSHKLEVVAPTEAGLVDKYTIDLDTGEIEKVEDSEEVTDLDRDKFIALVIAATEDKYRVVQRFFVRAANRIFDSIENDKNRLAQLKLRVFGKLLEYKKVNNEELNDAVEELKQSLKNK